MLPCHCQADTGLVPQGASVVTPVGKLLVASGVGGSSSLCSPHQYCDGVASFLLVMKKVLMFSELFPDTSAMSWGRGALFLPCVETQAPCIVCTLQSNVRRVCYHMVGKKAPAPFFGFLDTTLVGVWGCLLQPYKLQVWAPPKPLLLWVQVGTSFPGVPVEWSLSKPIVSLRCYSPGPFARRVTCGGVPSTFPGVCGFPALQLHVWDG